MNTLDVPSLEDASRLNDQGLRHRWRRLMGRPMPVGLGRPLVLRFLAYQQQAQRYGDLDAASRRALTDALGAGQGSNVTVDAAGSDTTPSRAVQRSRLLRPGTMLTREHGGVLHRVMVMEQGFGWHGRTFDSLSEVACAITGTRWNGPRFFGLRDKRAPQGGGSSKASKIRKRDATSHPGRDIAPGPILPQATPL